MFTWKLWCRSVLITINDSVTADGAAFVSRHHGLDDCMWSVCWGRGGCMIGSPSSFFAPPHVSASVTGLSCISCFLAFFRTRFYFYNCVNCCRFYTGAPPPPPHPLSLSVFLPFLCVCKLSVSSSVGIKITCTNGEWIASYYVTALP